MALTDQEIAPGWSIGSSIIMSPEINLKCSQKQSKTKNSYEGLAAPQLPYKKPSAANVGSLRSPHIHDHDHIDGH